MNDERISVAGLRELPPDARDLKLGAVFKMGDIKDVPNVDFRVSNGEVKDQRDTDFCTGYAVSSVSSAQEGVSLSPEYQFGVTKELMKDPESWGADLRAACKSAVNFGSLPQGVWDETFGIEARWDRDLVAYSNRFPEEWKEIAEKHKKKSFWTVDGNYDAFDNARLALWTNRELGCEIVTGAVWRSAWTKAKGGIVKKAGELKGFGHAFVLTGQKIIGGTPYIEARLSNGKDIGADGYFYFSRAVVNGEFERFGMFMFKDLDKEIAKVLSEWDLKINALTKLFAELIVLLRKAYGRR